MLEMRKKAAGKRTAECTSGLALQADTADVRGNAG
jgi:hypothetical protein